MSNIDAPDITMTVRGRNAASTGWFVGYSILALIVVPFLLIKQEAATLGSTLPFLMAGGLIFAGLWGTVTTFLNDPTIDKAVPGRNTKATIMLWMTIVLSGVTWIMASVAVSIGGNGWDSYDVLRSGGLLTYVVFGTLPFIAYFIVMQMVASRRIISGLKWQLVTVVCLAVSMLAPWFWAGFKVYSDYHTW